MPLKSAVFSFQIRTALPNDFFSREVFKRSEPRDQPLKSFECVPHNEESLNELTEILKKVSGADTVEIDTNMSTFSFSFVDHDHGASCYGGTPWAILEDIRTIKLDPRLEDEAVFDSGGFLKIGDEEAARQASRLKAVREATSLVWRQRILRDFDRAVSMGAVTLYARPALSRGFVLLPADIWPQLEVIDWENGTAVAADGTAFWSIHLRSAASPKAKRSLPTSLKNASEAMVHEAIRAAYDSAETTGRKPPNIRELSAAVQPLLKTKGYWASGALIERLGAEPRYHGRRRRPGKTWRSESRS
jgi:hypothetical protein